MTIFLLFVAIIIVLTYGLLQIIALEEDITKDGLLVLISKSWLVGLVILSYSSLIALFLKFIGLDIGIIGILMMPVIFYFIKRRTISHNFNLIYSSMRDNTKIFIKSISINDNTPKNIFGFILITIFLVYCALIILANATIPVSEWDCFMIWSLKSKLLYYDKLDLNFFLNRNFSFSQLDYPLLVPFMQSFISKIIGQYNENAGKVVFSLTFIAFSLLLYFFSTRFYKKVFSILVVSPFILMYVVSWNFTNALADSTLMTFFAGVVVFLFLYFNDPEKNKRSLLYVSIFILGCLMTKNEGLLLILSIFAVSIAYILIFFNRNETYLKSIIAHFIVPIFINLPWVIFIKLNNIINVEGISISSLLNGQLFLKTQDFILALFYLFEKVFFNPGDWGLMYIAFFILILALIKAKRAKELLFFGGTFAINIFIILLIYIQSPYGYEYHMGTSIDRVMLTLSPIVMILLILSPALIENIEQ